MLVKGTWREVGLLVVTSINCYESAVRGQPMDLGIDGNAALVTAGSAGLGYASAEVLAREGVNVAICGRDTERLETAAENLQSTAKGEILPIQADITKKAELKSFIAETVETFGRLDHVVTSAGGPPSGSFLEMTEDDWYDTYDLLVMSVVRTAKTAHPHLVEDGGGTIVMITSRTVKEVIDDLVLSNAVRRAVTGLMKTLSREFAPDIRVNEVLPGSHETSRIENLVTDAVDRGTFNSYEEGLAAWGEDVPLNRIGDPMELGDVVAWLSSERSSYVNGASVPIDGGSNRSA